jgi:beta-galactosidase
MTPRRRWLLDEDWRFHLGDIDSPLPNKHIAAYMLNKAGWARGAARGSFDDSDWRTVNLPHDWSVEGKIDRDNHMSGGFLPRGVGWYRRYFRLDESERGRRLTLQFDGVATHCTVYVNGHLLHRNFCGYTPFAIDISDVATFGDDPNVIAVRVDASYMEGWWYEGAGIYRHVYLLSTSPLHIAQNGVFVQPERTSHALWETRVQTTLENHGEKANGTIRSRLVSPEGHEISREETAFELGEANSAQVSHCIKIASPKLWSVESPWLYKLVSEVLIDARIVDCVETTFGYRTIRFDANEGFFLNDEPVRLKGTCNHQDHAGVGVAVPDSIHEFRVRRLKEMGCNAYRCAHNPPAPEVLDACDRLGMLVMDENRNFGSSPEHIAQLRTLVLRDRNHSSVIVWSICNEEAIQGTPVANSIARTMVREVKKLDPSRPVTAAVSGGILNDDCLADAVEVLGVNYQLAVNDAYHTKHPNKPLIAAETHSVVSTRGVYSTNRGKNELSSRDDEVASWGASARETWKFVSERRYIAGLFAWTGFDYRGEPTPFDWPCVSSFFGILDTCGFPKDAFYLHKAFFLDKLFVQITPHWNWREGQPIAVKVYSNCDEVELFLNDRSMGRRIVDRFEMANWDVSWERGTLRAAGWCGGVEVEHVVETTSSASAIGLEIHASAGTRELRADGEHAIPITVFATDSEGRRVPDAQCFVEFEIAGPAKIIGVGNGNPLSHENDKSSSRSLFNGLAQVIIQSTGEVGEVIVSATARDSHPRPCTHGRGQGEGSCQSTDSMPFGGEPSSQPSPGVPGEGVVHSAALIPAELRISAVASEARLRLPAVSPRYFINDWRMSPIRSSRPDPNEDIPEQDMNSWERVSPAESGQSTWSQQSGFAIYRGKLSPPRVMQQKGGRLVLHRVAGKVEVWIDSTQVAVRTDESPSLLSVALAPSTSPATISLLIQNDSTRRAGLLGRVELIPNG